jgi:hypothetical protein
MADTTFMWLVFGLLFGAMLVIDLGRNRKSHYISFREALIWSIVWIGLALLFNVGIYLTMGSGKALEFFTGYIRLSQIRHFGHPLLRWLQDDRRGERFSHSGDCLPDNNLCIAGNCRSRFDAIRQKPSQEGPHPFAMMLNKGSTSSVVTRPRSLPYSSTTNAICCLLCCISRSLSPHRER